MFIKLTKFVEHNTFLRSLLLFQKAFNIKLIQLFAIRVFEDDKNDKTWDYKLTFLTNNLKISGEQDKTSKLLLLFDRCRRICQGYNWLSTQDHQKSKYILPQRDLTEPWFLLLLASCPPDCRRVTALNLWIWSLVSNSNK